MRTRSQRRTSSRPWDLPEIVLSVFAFLLLFTTVLLIVLFYEPTSATAVETTQHVSSCWRVPFKPHLPTELQCQLESYQP